MGQKAIPVLLRITANKKKKNWGSIWFANKREFGSLVIEDEKIRQMLRKKPSCQGASKFTIRRMADKIEITIHTARPGLTIGKKGAEIEALKAELKKLTGKEIWIDVDEIKRPDLEAQLVADNVARQLERRIPFRRAVKKAVQASMDAGALGVRIRVAGRLGGAEIARAEWYKQGKTPLHTFKADIDYATSNAYTGYGVIGVKAWVNRGQEAGS